MTPSSPESGHGGEWPGGGAAGVERPQSTAAAGLLQLISGLTQVYTDTSSAAVRLWAIPYQGPRLPWGKSDRENKTKAELSN